MSNEEIVVFSAVAKTMSDVYLSLIYHYLPFASCCASGSTFW